MQIYLVTRGTETVQQPSHFSRTQMAGSCLQAPDRSSGRKARYADSEPRYEVVPRVTVEDRPFFYLTGGGRRPVNIERAANGFLCGKSGTNVRKKCGG